MKKLPSQIIEELGIKLDQGEFDKYFKNIGFSNIISEEGNSELIKKMSI